MNSINDKKNILRKIIAKKNSIENNYYSITRIIDDILFESEDDDSIELAKRKQVALDDATNFALSLLEKVIEFFLDSLSSSDSKKTNELNQKIYETMNKIDGNSSTNQIPIGINDHSTINENLNTSVIDPNNFNHVQYDTNYNDQFLYDSSFDYQPPYNESNQNDNNSIVDTSTPMIPAFENEPLNDILDMRETNGFNFENDLEGYSTSTINDFNDMNFNDMSGFAEITDNNGPIFSDHIEKKQDNPFADMNAFSNNTDIADLEDKLMSEIEQLKISNKMLSDSNEALFNQVNTFNANKIDIFDNSDYLRNGSLVNLDASINNMISKIELAKLPDFRNSEINNLEKISNTLIKSLENNLDELSNEVKHLKEENRSYRSAIDECNKTINDLKKESLLKEQELTESYDAWVFSNRKMKDLEMLLDQQTVDIAEIDGQKNHIIDSLEKKLRNALDNLDEALIQNEQLINKQNELEDFIRINDINGNYSIDSFNHDIETKSLHELVENETNRIVSDKLDEMLIRYKSELNDIENRAQYTLDSFFTKKQDLDFEIENSKKIELETIEILEQKIKDFEKKINSIEKNIIKTEHIESKTRKQIDVLNESLNYDEAKSKEFDETTSNNDSVYSKLSSIEKMISNSINNHNLINNSQVDQNNNTKVEIDIENEILNSSLYKNIVYEIGRLEEKVSYLKQENDFIRNENNNINDELDQSINNFVINSNKIREMEELLDAQLNELQKLNFEKDELIDALENKLIDQENKKILNPHFLENQYANNHTTISDENTFEIFDESTNQGVNLDNQQIINDEELKPIDESKIVSKEPNYMNNINKLYDNTISFNIEEAKSHNDLNNDELIIDHTFDTENYIDLDNGLSVENNDEINNTTIRQNDFVNNFDGGELSSIDNSEFAKSIIYDLQKNETILINEIARLQKEKEELINNTSMPTEVIKEKVVFKEVQVGHGREVPFELLDSNEKLKNFERLLIQMDTEISNLESDYLDKFVESQL